MITDRKGVLAQLAAFGYRAVEPFNILNDPEGLRADLGAAGLDVCSVHANPTGDQAEAVVNAARTLGADTIIVPILSPERFADLDGVRDVARELNEASRRLADAGLRAGYHNHDFELSSAIGDRPALEVLADHLDDGVILEVDTYWAAVGLRGPAAVPDLLRRLGERVRYLHVKDGPATSRDDEMTAVGAGRMPVAEILAANPSVQWHVVELDRCATDTLTAVRESLEWLVRQGLAR
ncbi:MAG TPA: sugar phosphate isomerase/epimerase [Streptosporangiaceae bacterium]